MSDACAPLTFYTHPQSRGRTARWMLEECGAPYDTVVLEYGTTMKAPAYLALHPMGKVPALQHGDVVVTETAAICTYLADVFPEKGLAPPAGSPQRAAYYRWLFFSAGPLETAVTAKALNLLAPAEQAVMVGYGSYASVMDTLEHAVLQARPHLCGEPFTAADLYVGSHLQWACSSAQSNAAPRSRRLCSRCCSARRTCARPRSTMHWQPPASPMPTQMADLADSADLTDRSGRCARLPAPCARTSVLTAAATHTSTAASHAPR